MNWYTCEWVNIYIKESQILNINSLVCSPYISESDVRVPDKRYAYFLLLVCFFFSCNFVIPFSMQASSLFNFGSEFVPISYFVGTFFVFIFSYFVCKKIFSKIFEKKNTKKKYKGVFSEMFSYSWPLILFSLTASPTLTWYLLINTKVYNLYFFQ